MDKQHTRIYLLRHGETVNTTDGSFRYNGHVDVDVTEHGDMQLQRQAERLQKSPVRAVYSSDLIRAVKGAQAISFPFSLESKRDTRLREINAGRWEGLTVKDVKKRFPGEFEKRFADLVNYRIEGGGENLLDVQKRARVAMGEIVERHRGESVAIVAHGGINRIILCDAMDLDLMHLLRIEQDFGCMNIIDYYNGTAVVRLLNLRP